MIGDKMQKRINLHGQDLYCLKEIISKYNLPDTFKQRFGICSLIIHFGDTDYVNQDNYVYLEQLAKMENWGYTINQALKKLGIETEHSLISHEQLLSSLFLHETFDDVIYYKRADVDMFAKEHSTTPFPVSEILSYIINERVIYIPDLFHYAADCKVKILDRRNPAIKSAYMLFPAETLRSIYGNIAVSCMTDMDTLLRSCSSISLANIMDNLLSPYDQNKINTIELFRRFFNKKMNASKSPRSYHIAIIYSNQLYRVYNNLNKEIYEYSENELKTVINNDCFNNSTAMQFLEFVRKRVPSFAKGMSFEYKTEKRKKVDQEIYSLNEWIALYDYLIDIRIHVQKAYADRVYAQYWLCMLVYLTSLIRISDIISLKAMYLERTRYIRPDELINHPLELNEAVTIVKSFRSNMQKLTTIKTDQIKHYYPLIEVSPAIATAICIVDHHRIRSSDIEMFTIRCVASDRIELKFEDIPVKFIATKATKTLASFLHAKAEENGKKNALFLISSARSHVIHDGFSETTPVYLQQSKLEGDPKEIAAYVCRRGVFGWLYIALLRYINCDIKKLEEATTQVEELKTKLSPDMIERTADFLYYAEKEQKSILHQFSLYSRDDIADFLMHLGTPQTSTSLAQTYCIWGRSCSRLRTDASACLHCQASLKTNYTLELISDKLTELLEKMDFIKNDNITERQKLSFQIQQLLLIIMDAKTWYDKYDKKFLTAYFDFKTIQKALDRIPDYKFLGG